MKRWNVQKNVYLLVYVISLLMTKNLKINKKIVSLASYLAANLIIRPLITPKTCQV